MSSYMPKAESIGEIKSNFVETVIDNEVVNGDFSDGTTGWSSNGYTGNVTATNNELTHTITSVASYAGIKSDFGNVTLDKYYISFEINPFRTHYPRAYIGGSVGNSVKIATSGQFTKHGIIITPVSFNDLVIYDNKAVDTSMEIGSITKYKNIFAINMTEMGIEDYSEEVMLKLVQQGYFESCNVLRMADSYFAESFDDNEILFTDGKPNLLQVDKLANITNNQLFVSLDKQKIMFYETPLTGDCLYKACKALKLNEPYMVQTAEGSGEYEPYITADGMLYVLKEGVEIK